MGWIAGYPREQIDWAPRVDLEKCKKCGMCMNCGKGVYEWTKDGPRVLQPNSCVIGCTTCGNLCLGQAISFPDIDKVREIYKREGIWGHVKRQLQEQGKLETQTE